MRKVIFILTICCISIFKGYSQTKQQSIKELFALMQQDSLIDKTFTSMLPSMMAPYQSEGMDSATMVRAAEIRNSSIQASREIAKKLINEDMVLIYDKYFTQKEIQDFIAFYKTPSGKKMIKLLPDIQKDVMTVMMQKYMPELQKTLKAKVEEMKNSEKAK